MRIDIAGSTVEVADRGAEIKSRRRRARGDGCGNAIAREEPDFHELGSPLHGVDTTAICIEAIAIAGLVVGTCGAAGSSSSADSAIAAVHPTTLVLEGHGAVRSGVGGDLIGGECVDTFDDIQLSMSGPI